MEYSSSFQTVEDILIIMVGFDGRDSEPLTHWNSANSLEWCKERLQTQHNRARVVTFEYKDIITQDSPIGVVDRAARALLSELDVSRLADADSSNNELSETGYTGAASLVLFICQGFAGLVVKKIFLCTPHSAEVEDWMDRMQMTADFGHNCTAKQRQECTDDCAQITKDFQQLSSLYMISYFCNDDCQEWSKASVLQSHCLWSMVSQNHLRWTTQENHYRIPRGTTAVLSRIYLERAVLGMCNAASHKSYHKCLETEQTIKTLYFAERLPCTCEWLLGSNTYREWVAAEGPACFWICGRPGSGKSTLCSVIVDNLLADQQQDDVIVFCFLEEGLGRYDCAKHVLEVLFRQLQERNAVPDFLLHSLFPRIEKNESPMSRETFQCLLRTLLSYIGYQNRVLLVLDGLDKHEWIEDLVVDEVIHINSSRYRSDLVRCLISSRGSCDDNMCRDQSRKISIDDEIGIQRDVLQFAESRLTKIYTSIGKASLFLTSFAKKICQRGQGNFLWVALVTEGLQCVESINEAEREVQFLPPTIDGLYERALQRISHQETEIAKRVFAWLIAAKRPLKLTEVAEVLAIETNPHGVPDILTLARRSWMTSPLITTTKENIVKFRHPSVRRHLLSTGRMGFWGFSMAEAHAFPARACITLLNSNKKFQFPLQSGTVRRTSSMLEYALANWSFHYGLAESHSKGLVSALHHSLTIALNLDCEEISLPQVGRMHHIESTILRIAAYCGFASLTRVSLEMGGDQNSSCDSCESPLALAAAGGHSTVVALLIERGASTTARTCSHGETALHFAAASGSLETARILLKNGAEANTDAGHVSRTPLHAAASSGNIDIIKSLMNCNVDLNAIIPTTGETSLHIAASSGHVKIVALLVEGLEPSNEELKSYESVVQQQYYRTWVEDLLTRSNWKCGKSSCETEAKCSARESLIELQSLRGRYADINLRTREGRTALHLAAFNGHVTIMRFLLQTGAKLDLTDTHRYTALRLAAENGHLSAVKLLLTARADLDFHQLSTTLKRVKKNGHHAVANLLAWHFFTLELTGQPCQWSVLALAIKSKRRIVRDVMRKNNIEDHSMARRLRTRVVSQDHEM